MIKNIGIVLASPYPWEIKTERNVEVLTKAGFNVFVLCVGEENKVYNFKEATVMSINRQYAKYFYYLTYSWTFSNFYFKNKIDKFIKEFNIQALQFQDLLLAKDCIKIAKRKDIPVVWETKENYPYNVFSTIEDSGKNYFPYNYFMGLKRWLRYERYAMEKVDKITYVIEEMKYRMIEDHPDFKDSSKFMRLTNAEIVENFKKLPIEQRIIDKYKNNYNIVYVGGFAKHRGLDTAIKSLKFLINKIPNIKLVIVGKGSNGDELISISKGYENNIEFTGWVDFKYVPSYIKMADICIIPHKSTRHTDHTMPHKLYHYTILEKTLLVSDSLSLKNIVKDNNIGFVFDADNEISFANKVEEIYKLKDGQLTNIKGNMNNFNLNEDYSKTSQKLIAYYKSIK